MLIRAGYPPALLPITSRVQYYEALETANHGNLEPFQQFIAERVLASLQKHSRHYAGLKRFSWSS